MIGAAGRWAAVRPNSVTTRRWCRPRAHLSTSVTSPSASCPRRSSAPPASPWFAYIPPAEFNRRDVRPLVLAEMRATAASARFHRGALPAMAFADSLLLLHGGLDLRTGRCRRVKQQSCRGRRQRRQAASATTSARRTCRSRVAIPTRSRSARSRHHLEQPVQPSSAVRPAGCRSRGLPAVSGTRDTEWPWRDGDELLLVPGSLSGASQARGRRSFRRRLARRTRRAPATIRRSP